jgi:hypothetical protein
MLDEPDGFATRAEAQAECDAANEPLSDSQILAAAALDWNMRKAAPPCRRPWTDMDALAAAIHGTTSRANAAALIATWRAPKRPPPAPEPAFEDEPREDAYNPKAQAEHGRRLLATLKNQGPTPPRRPR